MRKKKLLWMLLFDLLTVLAILTITAAFMTHPATDQSWLSYLLSVAKRAWSR